MNVLILPAAGIGARLGAGMPKTLVKIKDKTIVELAVEKFKVPQLVQCIIILAPRGYEKDFEKLKFPHNTHVLTGGGTRTQSVKIGIAAIKDIFPEAELVVIHDAARCFVTEDVVQRCINAAKIHDAVTAALPLSDTLVRCDKNKNVSEYLPRENVWRIQTPQVFKREIVEKAYSNFAGDATDDSSVVLQNLCPIKLVMGDIKNRKITFKGDM